jgi:hypothetical protein
VHLADLIDVWKQPVTSRHPDHRELRDNGYIFDVLAAGEHLGSVEPGFYEPDNVFAHLNT